MPVDLSIGAPSAPEVEAQPGSGILDDDDGLAAVEAPPVDESLVRGLLKGVGLGASYVAADDELPDQWKFTDEELDQLAPPLARIINRRPKLRAAVARGDEATVALLLASYAGRNVRDGKRVKEAREGGFTGEAATAAGPAGAQPQGAADPTQQRARAWSGDGLSGAAN